VRERGDGLVAGDRGELVKEFIESFAALKVIEKILQGDARAGKKREYRPGFRDL
jgi:hypothetical protein